MGVNTYLDTVSAAASFLRSEGVSGDYGLTLGSGLDDISSIMEVERQIPYGVIPWFPLSTAPGHKGEMIVGTIEGCKVIGLRGRKHAYEVLDKPGGMREVVFGVNVLAELGVHTYVATNAAGGMRTDPPFHAGDLMVIKDHVNFIPNPLAGTHQPFTRLDGEPVARFTPMPDAYDPELRARLLDAAKDAGAPCSSGVYVAVTGPTFETSAEIRHYRTIGDAIGMSTTPEVIAARSRGMRAAGISCITNVMKEDGTNATNQEEVLAVLHDPAVRARILGTMRGFFARCTS